MIMKFGKGTTLGAMTNKDNRKEWMSKWMPVIMMVVGAGLVIVGLVFELGAI